MVSVPYLRARDVVEDGRAIDSFSVLRRAANVDDGVFRPVDDEDGGLPKTSFSVSRHLAKDDAGAFLAGIIG